MESDWKKTSAANTTLRYHAFLSEYPGNPHNAEARKKIEALAWERASGANEIYAYRSFLKEYPSGEYSQSARARIVELEWQAAKKEDTRRAYEQFIQTHIDSSQAALAKDAVRQIDERAESSSFERASKSRSFWDVADYVQTFPNGKHRDEMKAALGAFLWTKLAEPKLLPWSALGKTALNSEEIATHANKGFQGISIYAHATGRQIARLGDIVFTAEGAQAPGGKEIPPCTFQIDGGNQRVLYFSTPGPRDVIHTLFPSVLIPVGSSFEVGSSLTSNNAVSSGGEASATVRSSSIVGRVSTSSHGGTQLGVVNLFGTVCRSGKVKVRAEGLELQSATEVLETGAP
jgi:outer membrane protein assembly factor BamD (BamD/ComL family)